MLNFIALINNNSQIQSVSLLLRSTKTIRNKKQIGHKTIMNQKVKYNQYHLKKKY